MASLHTTVQEHVGHLTRHGCDQKQFYIFIAYLVHQVYCIHCGYHCLYHYSQEHMMVYLCALATDKGGGGKLYLPDKRDQEHVTCQR